LINRYNRITALLWDGTELRLISRTVYSGKKKLLLWPVDTNILGSFRLKQSAMLMFKTVTHETVRAKDVIVLCTKEMKSVGSCRHEHFVLYMAPGVLSMSQEDIKKFFVDLGKAPPHRVSVINEIFELAWKHIRAKTELTQSKAA
jgi:hypothetical protein